MTDTVSKLAAFVFAHGELASEILFRDLDEDGELPGIRPEEREAMRRVEPMLRATWLGVLGECRKAVWARAVGHPSESIVQRGKTQDAKIWERGGFQMPLVDGWLASCGVTLEPWGADRYALHAWVWTKAKYRSQAEAAVVDLRPLPWRGENGTFIVSLPAPEEGETYKSVGDRVADALWPVASRVADAVTAAKLRGE